VGVNSDIDEDVDYAIDKDVDEKEAGLR